MLERPDLRKEKKEKKQQNPIKQNRQKRGIRGGSGAVEENRASDLPIIEPGSKEWDNAVKNIKSGGSTSYRTRTATDAKGLLNESRGNMDRYKRYTSKQYKKGYEMHPNEINTRNAPHNDLPHIIMARLA